MGFGDKGPEPGESEILKSIILRAITAKEEQ
jgi:hypothetical protein